jgi:hypothetical protein
VLLAEVYAAGEAPIVAADGRALARALRVAGQVEPVFVADMQDMPQAVRGQRRGRRRGAVHGGRIDRCGAVPQVLETGSGTGGSSMTMDRSAFGKVAVLMGGARPSARCR